MDKLYYIWLQEIANNCNEFLYDIYEKLMEDLKLEDVKELYELKSFSESQIAKIKKYFKEYDILLRNDIKIEAEGIFRTLRDNHFDVIPSYYYISKYIDKRHAPFCIFIDQRTRIDFKKFFSKYNILIHYDTYFSEYARRIVWYFLFKLEEEKDKVNPFSQCIENISIERVVKSNVLDVTFVESMDNLVIDKNEYMEYLNFLILPNKKYYLDFYTSLIDSCIIIEARYEQNIVEMVNMFLDKSKEIFVVPSNIYKKNSYFSNYLIKQGAQIVLNKWDLMEIIKNI